MSVIVAAASTGASTAEVFGAVFAGVGVLVVVLGGILGAMWRHIGSVKTELREDIKAQRDEHTALRTDLTTGLSEVRQELHADIRSVESAVGMAAENTLTSLRDLTNLVHGLETDVKVMSAREEGRAEAVARWGMEQARPERPAAG